MNQEFDEAINTKVKEAKERIEQDNRMGYVNTEEIMEVMRKLPLGKSPGPAQVKCELVKYSTRSRSVFVISKFLEKMINCRTVPKNMNRGTIVPIIKDEKGEVSSIKNIRGITVSGVMSVIFEHYILEQINKKIKLDDRQYGFRKKSSTSHAFWVYEGARRQLHSEGKKGYVIFLDFSKAFDKVTRNKMLVALKDDLNELEWLALANYYEVAMVNVFVHKSGGTTEWFATKVGVKQGGPFSPTGFNKHINACITEIVDSNMTITIRKVKGGILVYADDTTVISRSAEQMHSIIAMMVNFCLKYDIIINEQKTQWMKIGDPVRETETGMVIMKEAEPEENFMINGKFIEKVDRFKLLGIWTMSNGSHRVHITKRIKAAYELGLNDPKMDPKIIGTLISSYVRPMLMYGTEALELSDQEMRDQQMCETKIIKRAMNLPYNCYDTQLYEMLAIQSLDWAIKKRKISFLKQLVENKITGKMIITRQTAMDYVLHIIGAGEQGNRTDQEYLTKIASLCDMEITRINQLESNNGELSQYTKTLKNLWQNREVEGNEETLMLFFKTKNDMRELYEYGQMDGG